MLAILRILVRNFVPKALQEFVIKLPMFNPLISSKRVQVIGALFWSSQYSLSIYLKRNRLTLHKLCLLSNHCSPSPYPSSPWAVDNFPALNNWFLDPFYPKPPYPQLQERAKSVDCPNPLRTWLPTYLRNRHNHSFIYKYYPSELPQLCIER